MSRTKEGRDALRSSEAHPQAGSIAPPRSKRSQRRVPLSRHRPKSAKTGEAYPPPCADPRHIREEAGICPADSATNPKYRRHNRAFFNKIDVKLPLQIETAKHLGWLFSACAADSRRTENLEEKGGPVAAYGSRAYHVRPLVAL